MSESRKFVSESSVRKILLLTGMILLAIYFRWRSFPFTQIYSDSLSPFVGGIRFLEQGVADPPNPEADHWLWVSTLPFLVTASSLNELFWFRYLGSVIIIPLSMFATDVLLAQHRYRCVAVAATGLFLAVDSGLLDSLNSSFRGYFAPEYLALSTVGVALIQTNKNWGLWIAVMGSVLASGQHPLALGTFLGTAFLCVSVWKQDQRVVLIGGAVFLLCLLPRMIWLWTVMQCDSGGLECLQNIAVSSAEETSMGHQILRLFHDRFWVEMGLGGPFLLLGLWFSRKNLMTRWTLFSMAGILILGLSISTLRPYHFRIVAVPMVIASVMGWIRYKKIMQFVFPLWGVFLIVFPPEPVAWKNNIKLHDRLASVLCAQEDSFWIEGYGTERLEISVQGVAVAYWLQDCKKENVDPQVEQTIFLLGEKGLNFPVYTTVEDVVIYRPRQVKDVDVLSSEYRISGYDFAIVFQPEQHIVLR